MTFTLTNRVPNVCMQTQEKYTESEDACRICIQMEDRLRASELQAAGPIMMPN